MKNIKKIKISLMNNEFQDRLNKLEESLERLKLKAKGSVLYRSEIKEIENQINLLKPLVEIFNQVN